MATYGHLNRLPHTKLAPELHTDVVDALDFAVLQMDKVLNHSQKTAFTNKTLVLKTYEFKGFGSFRCASAATEIFHKFQAKHAHEIIIWPIVRAAKTVYNCPHGHSRDAANPPFILHDPPKMVWCPSCKRPFSHMRWVCLCNQPWQDCLIHRPTVITVQRAASEAQREPKMALANAQVRPKGRQRGPGRAHGGPGSAKFWEWSLKL